MTAQPNFWMRKWQELASIDLRTLALFRIGMAIVILIDLATFWPEIGMMLTDAGVYPRSLAIASRPYEAFSLFFISGGYAINFLLFALTTLAALAMLFGYYTRIATFVCWLMIASLNVRASVFLSSADVQLIVMLFWAMFLPLGARFSIDQALAEQPAKEKTIASVATLALLLQVTYLYLMGALLKTGDAWQVHYNAVEAAIANVQMATYASAYLMQWPTLMKWLTIYVYNLELYAAFFLFFPFFNTYIRIVMFVLLASMHLGFLIFLDISYFPLVSLVGVTVFLPYLVWDWLEKWLDTKPSLAGHVIYYDEDCGFCKKTCLIFRELSFLRHARIEPAQHYPDIYAIMQRENSWVVITPAGRTLLHWEAVAYVWRRSPLLWPFGVLFAIPFMRPVGRQIYQFIATYRAAFGAITGKFLPYHPRVGVEPTIVNSLIVAPMIVIVFFLNIKNMQEYKNMPFPPLFYSAINYTKLWQRWSMFAPYPTTGGFWAVVEGKLVNGQVVDLLFDSDTPPTHARPARGPEAFPSRRWHKFFSFNNWERNASVYAKAHCAAWAAARKPIPLERVIVTTYKQRNMLGTPVETWPIGKKVLIDYPCFPPKKPDPSIAPAQQEAPAPQEAPNQEEE